MEPQHDAGENEKFRLVTTLLGHAHIETGLVCLASLLRFSATPLRLRIHDDGSLSAVDLERLAAALSDPEVVSRREADERLAGLLAAYPAARAFRAANPLALKLLDVTLLYHGTELAFCDSDILFLRPFCRLFHLPTEAGTVLMSDPRQSYSVRSWQLLLESRLRLPGHINTGVIAFRRRCFDLDLVEWFLARSRYGFAPVWVEQTCWGLLAQPAGCCLLDPQMVSIFAPGDELSERQVALHFVTPVRGQLERFASSLAELGVASDKREPIVLRSVAAPRLTAAALAATEAGRRYRRLRAWRPRWQVRG